MKLNLLYFASLRETLGCASEELELPAGIDTIAAVRTHLAGRGGEWTVLTEERRIRAALNQRMAGADEAVTAGDELAFFPPVTGG